MTQAAHDGLQTRLQALRKRAAKEALAANRECTLLNSVASGRGKNIKPGTQTGWIQGFMTLLSYPTDEGIRAASRARSCVRNHTRATMASFFGLSPA